MLLVDPVEREEKPERGGRDASVLLSIVVPVYNQGRSIAANLIAIRDRTAALPGASEVIAVSDGSVDETAAEILAARSDWLRVIHYDRNLGKGYAVKVGALAARGRWIAYVDADLDLDPSALPEFLAVAQDDDLDFAIGSKRHPDSVVHYPASRRVASWLYQQLVRLLMDLDVRDTQVGLKLFRREVADEVMPLLLTKRYAFDVELLAVARSFGFARVRELPITLDYRFTGSGVRSMAVVRALVDTAAVFYRLRVLRYYARKRALLGDAQRSVEYRPLVSLVARRAHLADHLDYDRLELVALEPRDGAARAAAARVARGELVAFVGPADVPASNWVSSAVPFLARPEISAVAAPRVAPASGRIRELAAAAVFESRLGGGSLYFRYLPGNLRFVTDFPEAALVVRRTDFIAAHEVADAGSLSFGEALQALGKRVLYTPDTFVLGRTPPLVRPHLAGVAAYGRARARDVRRRGRTAVRPSTVLAPAVPIALGAAVVAAAGGPASRRAVGAVAALYAGALAFAGATAALRFRRAGVMPAVMGGLVGTHLVYSASFLRELARRRRAP